MWAVQCKVSLNSYDYISQRRLTFRIYKSNQKKKEKKNNKVCFQFEYDRNTYTSDWIFSTGRGGVKKHILFRSGQDFKEALNQ